MSLNLRYYSRSFIIFLALISFSSFNGFSQTISIGSPVDATEGSGSPASFIISLDNGAINTTGADITGTITLSGTATPGVDYLGPMSFAIANGSNSIGMLVPIVDDALVECDETIIATISNPSVGSINPGAASSSATIIDDECATQYVVSIGSPVDATEGTGTSVSCTVSLDNGAINTTGANITGMITLSGTATVNLDYLQTSSFVIANGANSSVVSIPVVDDNVCEPTETVTASISNPNVGTINPANSSSTANIFDDDCGSLLISIGSPVDATESPSGSSLEYTISIVAGGSSAVSIMGTIAYSGAALNGIDYNEVNTYTIPAGMMSTTISVPVIDDLLIEPTETVIATLTGSPNVGTYANTTSTANIYDNDAASVVISIGSPVDGAEAISPTDASFEVFIEGGAVNNTGFPIDGFVNYSGTATGFDDYNGPFSFSIPNGANSTTLTLVVNDDLLLECDETVIATISNPNAGTIGNASSTAIITDDECNSTTISIVSPMDGEEGVSDVSFVITLDNGVINGTGGAIMGDVAYSGTATAGVDFSDIPGWSIPDGASFVTHVLPVLDDLDDECDESVIATISNPSFATINIATDSATIVDNDCTLGIDILSTHELNIFPNPAGSSVNFESEIRMSSYAIIDLKGRVLSEGDINAKELSLNMDFLATGTYIFNVTFEDGTSLNSKILKE